MNVDEFLAEIPGDTPAGSPVPFAVKAELEEARKEIDPDDYDPNDPARPAEVKRADWPAIVALAGQTLKETSKDLLVAARMTEALTRVRGFDGLADGLAVMRGLVGTCWDRMYPEVEDGDLEVRAGPFHWLSEADRGARFPHTVRNTPLLSHGGVAVGWRQWKESQDGKGGFSREEFERAVNGAPREVCKAAFDAVTRVITEITGLGQLLNEKMGPESPGMSDLRAAVGECYGLVKQILDRKGPDPTAAEGDGEAGGEPAAAGGDPSAPPGRGMASRADVYRRLSEAADLLERLEPHSPIPYLVRKAVELGGLPFPLLMRALIRDANVLGEMNRELGIREPEPAE